MEALGPHNDAVGFVVGVLHVAGFNFDGFALAGTSIRPAFVEFAGAALHLFHDQIDRALGVVMALLRAQKGLAGLQGELGDDVVVPASFLVSAQLKFGFVDAIDEAIETVAAALGGLAKRIGNLKILPRT